MSIEQYLIDPIKAIKSLEGKKEFPEWLETARKKEQARHTGDTPKRLLERWAYENQLIQGF